MVVIASPEIAGLPAWLVVLAILIPGVLVAIARTRGATRRWVIATAALLAVAFVAIWANDEWNCKLIDYEGIWLEDLRECGGLGIP